jgi:phospholipid/cholesterol/gamma-HCH transport system substrate-binding protein
MYQVKKHLRWSALKSGTLITLTLVLVFMVVLYAGALKKVFTPTFELQAQFRDVKGLRNGAPVWLYGTEVGSVEDIRLDPMYGTIVTMSIDKNAQPYIRNDSKAEILTMGLLGDKYVDLSPGLPEQPPLEQGSMIKGQTPMELSGVVESSNRAIQKIAQLVDKVDQLVEEISQGKGTISKLILDPSLYNSVLRSATSLEATLERLERSRGTLNLLIEDPSLYNKTLSAAASIEKIMRDLENGKGSLGKLMTEPQLYENLNQTVEDLDAVLKEINTGKGMATAFLRDEELVRQVKESIAEIRAVAGEMKSLLKDVEEHPEKYFKFSVF